MRILSFIITLLISSALANHDNKDEEDERINLGAIVKEVNDDATSLWKADTYQMNEISLREVRSRLGAQLRKNEQSSSNKISKLTFLAEKITKLGYGTALPRFYDARKMYPKCNSISQIRDQSYCGSCWAVSAASVFSDRLCIRSKGRYNYELSSRFITACDKRNFGCKGGYLATAWKFLERNGTVSGGEFHSDEGCQPYPFHPCGWPKKLACPVYLTPKCLKNKCENEFYSLTHEKYPIKARNSYRVRDPFYLFDEYYIREEIYKNGPVQAGFYVFADFITYKSGIYKHMKGRYLGGHAVKIIGWGEEKEVKYWIIANSWGESWGEDGIVRMIRGEDDCGIEDEVFAGIPKL